MSRKETLNELCRIAKLAGQEILRIYMDSKDVEIERKSDSSPLTIADKASNDIICMGLENIDPYYPIISEENKQIAYAERKDYEYAWMVDPLDGTKEFIKRNGEFTVNIALIHKNRSIMGVVYVPVEDKCYYASEGEGAFLIDKDGVVSQLHCNNFKMDDEGIRVVASRSHLNPETEAFMGQLKQAETVAKGSSLKFLVLASGGAELYPRLAPTMEWDTAAAHIILEEAGGSVVQYGTKDPLEYNKENLLNPHFLASAKLKN
jgi:3'(2'), 5'-bisphosphate nucleotidase